MSNKSARNAPADRPQISEREHRRAQPGRQQQCELEPLLYNRAQVALLLNRSIATIRRLERRGILRGIRLDPGAGPNAPVMYRAADIRALVGSE